MDMAFQIPRNVSELFKGHYGGFISNFFFFYFLIHWLALTYSWDYASSGSFDIKQIVIDYFWQMPHG